MEFWNQQDSVTRFNVEVFLKYFLYHQLYNLGLIPIAFIVIYVMEGFKFYPIINMQFLHCGGAMVH